MTDSINTAKLTNKKIGTGKDLISILANGSKTNIRKLSGTTKERSKTKEIVIKCFLAGNCTG